jgi:hypothetical protein
MSFISPVRQTGARVAEQMTRAGTCFATRWALGVFRNMNLQASNIVFCTMTPLCRNGLGSEPARRVSRSVSRICTLALECDMKKFAERVPDYLNLDGR